MESAPLSTGSPCIPLAADSVVSDDAVCIFNGKQRDQNTSTWKRLYKVRSFSMDQEERRKTLLESQKKKREKAYYSCRQMDVLELEEGAEEEEEEEEQLEDMECAVATPNKKKRRPKKFANMLMHSEWLTEVPPDLEDKWYFVPCPVGKRCLVIAEEMTTQAFSSCGKHLAKFESLLPGGARSSNASCRTVLDCVWSWRAQTYFVLDVLAWGNQPFLDCETEFRFFWLKSQLEELEGISEIQKRNKYRFVPLPFRPCLPFDLSESMFGPAPFSEVMDGVLFYHREAHYKPGPSPLVVWLLPFMLPEVLGVEVSEALTAQQPPNYPGHLEFVQHFQTQDRKDRREQYRQRKAASRAILHGNNHESSMDAQSSDVEENEETIDNLEC